MKPAEETGEIELPAVHEANPGFALGQLAAALATSQGHEDADTRSRAARKVEKWIEVLTGMLSGGLKIGSRTPLRNAPPWATLEVVHGGFTTGGLLAGGPLRPHETELLARIGGDPAAKSRAALNGWYLREEGMAELRRMLADGRYRIEVPEEGALLVVAWLLAHGQVEAAQEVLAPIAGHLGMLRFYPVPADRPLRDGPLVHLRTAGEVAGELQALRVKHDLQVQREALRVWAPLADRAVALFLETVEGPVPALETDPDGRPLRSPTGRFSITGGWPCQHYPEGWRERALALLADYRRLRKEHRLSDKPDRKGGSFALLRHYLERCAAGPERLTGREVGMIRLLLAAVVTRRGAPGSERHRRLRADQATLAARPAKAELARVVAARLAALPPEEGVESLDGALAPVTAAEAGAHGVPEGTPLAERLADKVRRALAAPVETLVEEGVISSGEELARVVPDLTGQVRAAGLPDPELRRLYAAVYRAFRRRRSLLLLNLESQVKLPELPWIRAMEAQRGGGPDALRPAREALERVAALALAAFPHQIVPNQLLKELRVLAEGAELRLPLVDEVAADIFMGVFSEKFLRAAQMAGALLEGTLYARYYGIDYAHTRRIDDVTTPRRGETPTSPAFSALCAERAEPAGASWVARNGTIIEQEQILTTHNLAVLFAGAGLAEALAPRLGELAHRCFAWICHRQQQPMSDWRSRLHMVKNTAYAWRQMVFFLALEPEGAARAFLPWAWDHLARQRPDFQARFRPALEGLSRAMDGLPTEDGDAARRFLGWTTGRHWLLERGADPDAAAGENAVG